MAVQPQTPTRSAARSSAPPEVARPLVVVPAFNEDRYIGSVVLKLRAAGYDVMVVDDGSSDSTGAVARSAGAAVLSHPSNLGKAAAVATAFEYVRTRGPDVLVLMDGDSQHDPADVAAVAEPVLAGRADMSVGTRFAGVHSRIPRWRVLGQRALTAATNVGSGVELSDSQSGFRAFSRRAIEAMHFGRTGFSVESEMQFQARDLKLTVEEVPIHVHYDLPNKRNPVRQGLNVIDGILRLVAQHRPLLFFALPGLLILAVGLAVGHAVVRIYDATLTLAVGYALISVLLSIVGTLAAFVGVMLHAMGGLVREGLRQALTRKE